MAAGAGVGKHRLAALQRSGVGRQVGAAAGGVLQAVRLRGFQAVVQGDVPVYLSDCAALFSHTTWRPRRGVRDILTDIHEWVLANEALVLGALG